MAHGLANAGMIAGELGLYRDRIVFAATPIEDALRQEPTVIDMRRDEVVGVRVFRPSVSFPVPGTRGLLKRPRYRQVLVETHHGTYRFEPFNPVKVASQIRDGFGIRS